MNFYANNLTILFKLNDNQYFESCKNNYCKALETNTDNEKNINIAICYSFSEMEDACHKKNLIVEWRSASRCRNSRALYTLDLSSFSFKHFSNSKAKKKREVGLECSQDKCQTKCQQIQSAVDCALKNINLQKREDSYEYLFRYLVNNQLILERINQQSTNGNISNIKEFYAEKGQIK